MLWPQSQEYNEAIQNPKICFKDPELKAGQAVTNALGMPIPSLQRERQAAGVMMIPIPGAGTLQEVRGVAEALPLPSSATAARTFVQFNNQRGTGRLQYRSEAEEHSCHQRDDRSERECPAIQFNAFPNPRQVWRAEMDQRLQSEEYEQRSSQAPEHRQ